MALTNNGKFRRFQLTINKKVNSSLQTTGGYPIIHDILDAFALQPLITQADLAVLTDAEYTARLNAFYDFLETTYSFFTRAEVLNSSSGIDAVICPLDNTAAPVITAVGDPVLTMDSVSAGATYPDLTWFIRISEPAPQDMNYAFDVNLRDKNNLIIRTERLYGIIRQGKDTHDSYLEDGHYVYIPEAENNFYAPVLPEFIPGSINLNL